MFDTGNPGADHPAVAHAVLGRPVLLRHTAAEHFHTDRSGIADKDRPSSLMEIPGAVTGAGIKTEGNDIAVRRQLSAGTLIALVIFIIRIMMLCVGIIV